MKRIALLLVFYPNFLVCCLCKRYIGANPKNFMNIELNQAIMVRYKLRNIFLKLETEENRFAYVRQGNYCVKLLRQEK